METSGCTSMVMEKCVETSGCTSMEKCMETTGCTSMEKCMQGPPTPHPHPPPKNSFSTSQQTNNIRYACSHTCQTGSGICQTAFYNYFTTASCVVMFLPLHCLLLCCHVSSTSQFVAVLSCFFHFTICWCVMFVCRLKGWLHWRFALFCIVQLQSAFFL